MRTFDVMFVVGLIVVPCACGGSTSEGGAGSGGAGATGGTSGTGGNAGTGGVSGTGGVAGQAGTSAGGQAGGGAADAGPDANPACAASPPTGACATEGTACWYGDDPRYFCKTEAVCNQGAWNTTLPLTGCAGEPPAACPADPSSVPAGICDNDAGPNPICVYATEYCTCGFTGGWKNSWVCAALPAAGCPSVPPVAGSACAPQTTTDCVYGMSCSAPHWRCENGVWNAEMVEC